MSDFRYGAVQRRALLGLIAGLAGMGAAGRALRVGPGQAVKTLAEAARLAVDGQVVEVEPGEYRGDVAVWPQQDLTLRPLGANGANGANGTSGRVRIVAAGASAQRKAIFVTRGERLRIERFDFVGCRVPDGNGAGVRLEAGSLQLVDCGFRDNEMGVLTANDPRITLVVEDCDFGHVQNFRGVTHNLYVGRIGELSVSGSYFHHGNVGHLLKSRAALNRIVCNRLSDGDGGGASYELEFPDGGQCLVVGNLIQQSATTQNPIVLSYGAEGRAWPRNELLMAHNTLIDRLPRGGRFLRVAGGPVGVRLVNNLFVGAGDFSPDSGWALAGNHLVADEAATLIDGRLRSDSPLRGTAVDPGDEALRLRREYRHPHGSVALDGPARDPGALQSLRRQ